MAQDLNWQAVENFKEYLRIQSVHPNCDYDGCVKFLQRQGERLGLPVVVHEVMPKKPVVIISWSGSHPELPSLLLSSHMDVVPVFKDKWTHEPFGAEEDEVGNIYARGAQDMKCVGIQYLEATYRLISQGYKPQRSIHICFTPDEEIGLRGMAHFVKTEAFKNLNVGCALDEGVASTDEVFNLYYGERTSYPITIICNGTPGHGSLLHEATAGEKLQFVLNKFMEKRWMEKEKLKNPGITLGDVTTINVTMVRGGVQPNVVPPAFTVFFDCRLSHDVDCDDFSRWVSSVCAEAGDGVEVLNYFPFPRASPTNLDSTNPWWVALKDQFNEMNLKIDCKIFPASSDSMWIRSLGIPAFGFSPMNFTPVLLHDNDEFLNKDIFIKGIEIYGKIIPALVNV